MKPKQLPNMYHQYRIISLGKGYTFPKIDIPCKKLDENEYMCSCGIFGYIERYQSHHSNNHCMGNPAQIKIYTKFSHDIWIIKGTLAYTYKADTDL